MPTSQPPKKCPKPYGRTIDGHVISCKKWDCPHCAAVKIMRIANKVGLGFHDRVNLYRVTITQRLGSTRNIMKDWELVRKRLQRRMGYKVSYFWVKEKTKQGQRHLHLLIDTPVDWRWLKTIYGEITNGESFHVYVTEEPVLHSWGYAMKYMTKDLDSRWMYDYKERKYGFSIDFRGITGDQPDFRIYNSKENPLSVEEDYVDFTRLLNLAT